LTSLSPPLLCAVALVVAAAGGLLPFTPIEPMLIGIAAVTQPSLLIVVIVVATVGQMASKWVLYAGSCRAADALRPDRRVAVDKAMARLSGTRRRQLLTVLLSAAAGLPPFYVVTVARGVARLRLTDFVIAGTIGRAARFTVIMLPPNLYLRRAALRWSTATAKWLPAHQDPSDPSAGTCPKPECWTAATMLPPGFRE
jgi:membrane protein YqaA with SNARE-associated domain